MRITFPAIAVLTIAVIGCGTVFESSNLFRFSRYPLAEIQGSELLGFVNSSDQHVLVEFGLKSNCQRCDSMKPAMKHLAKKYQGYAEIVHVDYTENLDLISKYGAKACPAYVLFEKGDQEPIFVSSFPISTDNLEAELLAVLAFSMDN